LNAPSKEIQKTIENTTILRICLEGARTKLID